MAAYRRVYDLRHLQADCQEPGSAPEPYTLGNRVWATFTLFFSAEMSGPKDRSVRTCGPNCLSVRTEMSQYRMSWCRSALGPNCLGSEVSVSRCVN